MALGDQESAISANEAFYDAFAAADISAMEAIWAHHGDVTCLHPGWPRLEGREAVLNSWRGILLHPGRPQIECIRPTATVHGDTAIVLCYELMETACLLATNVFVREAGMWRLVHHHAGGPVPSPE
jgi:ketosteroid isomerase-like protein